MEDVSYSIPRSFQEHILPWDYHNPQKEVHKNIDAIFDTPVGKWTISKEEQSPKAPTPIFSMPLLMNIYINLCPDI